MQAVILNVSNVLREISAPIDVMMPQGRLVIAVKRVRDREVDLHSCESNSCLPGMDFQSQTVLQNFFERIRCESSLSEHQIRCAWMKAERDCENQFAIFVRQFGHDAIILTLCKWMPEVDAFLNERSVIEHICEKVSSGEVLTSDDLTLFRNCSIDMSILLPKDAVPENVEGLFE